MPDGEVSDESDENYCNRRFQYMRVKKRHFWNRWRREYLADLREFHSESEKTVKGLLRRVMLSLCRRIM